MRTGAHILLALLLALTAAGCGEGGGGESTDSMGTSVTDYLAALPAPAESGEIVTVTYADLARASEIAGLERPDDPADVDAVADWLQDLTGVRADSPVAALPPDAAEIARAGADQQAFVDDVGWSLLEVDSFAERATVPARVTVLDGAFDRDRLESVLADAGDGVWVAGDPDKPTDVAGVTPARPLGQPLWLTLDGGRLRVAADERDTSTEGDTLADDAALVALAGALDDRDVYAAMLASGGSIGSGPPPDIILDPPSGDIDDIEDALVEEASRPRCVGVTGVAVGVADDGEPVIVVLLSQPGDAAEANAGALAAAFESGMDAGSGRPWSDLVTVESVDVEGDVVVATLRPADLLLGSWRELLLRRSIPPC
jgi:hypothetical protein